MFCDLVGSTALSARLDPEDMRAIIGSYHKAVAKAVQDHDGFVAKYIGDGVLAYFGYPTAHEDDAERDHRERDRAGLDGNRQHGPVTRRPARSEEILARIPLGRWGLPSDLGGPVVFLASDASAYITGHALAVDGGWLAR
jgi:class 3 adenylate cyclase